MHSDLLRHFSDPSLNKQEDRHSTRAHTSSFPARRHSTVTRIMTSVMIWERKKEKKKLRKAMMMEWVMMHAFSLDNGNSNLAGKFSVCWQWWGQLMHSQFMLSNSFPSSSLCTDKITSSFRTPNLTYYKLRHDCHLWRSWERLKKIFLANNEGSRHFVKTGSSPSARYCWSPQLR